MFIIKICKNAMKQHFLYLNEILCYTIIFLFIIFLIKQLFVICFLIKQIALNFIYILNSFCATLKRNYDEYKSNKEELKYIQNYLDVLDDKIKKLPKYTNDMLLWLPEERLKLFSHISQSKPALEKAETIKQKIKRTHPLKKRKLKKLSKKITFKFYELKEIMMPDYAEKFKQVIENTNFKIRRITSFRTKQKSKQKYAIKGATVDSTDVDECNFDELKKDVAEMKDLEIEGEDFSRNFKIYQTSKVLTNTVLSKLKETIEKLQSEYEKLKNKQNIDDILEWYDEQLKQLKKLQETKIFNK